jgi:sulfatase maturation enzyme AslB (radical SAM superfamily)
MASVSVRYVSNLQRCNFACSYCASSQPARQRNPRLPTWSVGADVHERVVDWLTRQPHSIRLRMNSIAGMGFTPATRSADPRALALGNRNNALGASHALSAAPAGKSCAAGGSYFYVHSSGDVFPCRTYAQALQTTRLGSALDKAFELQPRRERFRPCSAPGRCGCPEDYQNLEAIQSRFGAQKARCALGRTALERAAQNTRSRRSTAASMASVAASRARTASSSRRTSALASSRWIVSVRSS